MFERLGAIHRAHDLLLRRFQHEREFHVRRAAETQPFVVERFKHQRIQALKGLVAVRFDQLGEAYSR